MRKLTILAAVAFVGASVASAHAQCAFDGAANVLTDGLFGCVAYRTYARIIADEAYDHVGFSATLALKDATLVLAAGEAAGVPLPGANTLRDRLLGAIAHGDGERDWAVIAREQARASGLG